jgi:hypothetical protein
MTDVPAPAPHVPTAPVPRFHPALAFAAAGASLACALAGIALMSPSSTVEIAVILAAIAVPGWLGVGIVLLTRTAGLVRPTARARAWLILVSIGLGLVSVTMLGMLLHSVYPMAAIAFAATCVVAVFLVDRAS